MKESCSECYFFRGITMEEKKSCSRYPPQVDQYGDTIFPIVAPDWWCGEFAPADKIDILRSDPDEEELP